MKHYTPYVTPLAYYPELDMVMGQARRRELDGQLSDFLVLIPRPVLYVVPGLPFGDDQLEDWTITAAVDAASWNGVVAGKKEMMEDFILDQDSPIDDVIQDRLNKNAKLDAQKNSMRWSEGYLEETELDHEDAADMIRRISRRSGIAEPKVKWHSDHWSHLASHVTTMTATFLCAGTASAFFDKALLPTFAAAAAGFVASSNVTKLARGFIRNEADYQGGKNRMNFYKDETDVLIIHEMAHAVERLTNPNQRLYRFYTPDHGALYALIYQSLLRHHMPAQSQGSVTAFIEMAKDEDVTGEAFMSAYPFIEVVRTPERAGRLRLVAGRDMRGAHP